MDGPSTTSTVSASGLEAIETKLDVKRQLQIQDSSIEVVYDIESTVEELLQGGWTRICLQFPDELLHDSVHVFKAIRARLPDHVELYVMADTTHGSCCVDEVAAQHVDAQVVVHYGHACLSAPARLAVLYVFPKAPIDEEHAAKALYDELQSHLDIIQNRNNLLLLSDVAYHWKMDEIYENLSRHVGEEFQLVKSEIDTKAFLRPAGTSDEGAPSTQAQAPTTTCCQSGAGAETIESASCCGTGACGSSDPSGSYCGARQVPLPPPASSTHQKSSCRSYSLPPSTSLAKDFVILYIGPESLTMSNLLLENANTPVISYLPEDKVARLESGRTNKMLMRRYGTISTARDADVYGIVVGTLGVSSYLPTLAYLRKLLKKHKKKSYTMAVGKLTPAKLGNFLEVETWVLVACGENSLVSSHKEFMRPIITPWELEVALGEREWITGGDEEDGDRGYTLDFGKVLEQGEGERKEVLTYDVYEKEEDERDDEAPIFSTATGQYRHRRKYGGKEDVKDANDLTTQAQALSIRNQQSALSTVLSSAGGEFLSQRMYQGLDPRYGQDAPSVLEQGRSGVARGYEGDKEASGL